MKKLLKFLHLVASAGLLGGLATYLVLAMLVPGENPDAFAAIRRGIHVLAEWVILPSLLLALVSGLLSIYVSPVLLVRQDITHKAITSHKVRL
jgi:putative copper export protein